MNNTADDSEGNKVVLRPRDGDVVEDYLRKDIYYSPFSMLNLFSPMRQMDVLEGYSIIGGYVSRFFTASFRKIRGILSHNDISDVVEDCPSDYTRKNRLL